mmetsp:Transcript_117345/g.364777  ORF Transcript_117345/g.364777 Transcript_117345/m.364777 type:complete len:307 (-) Transcript_117345:83-1003(-)
MKGAGLPADVEPLALLHGQNVSWNMRGAWLLQSGGGACGPHDDLCRAETLHALLLLVCLCSTIMAIICAFAFFREDKEEQITPLCPQLVVKEADLSFKMPLDSQADSMTVVDINDQPLCKVAMDWPDPFRPGASGVAATVRLQSNLDLTLATVVARNVAVVGQGLALCRAGCEIFGFVEPEGPRRYSVRHRTGLHLLTLVGDFAAINIEGINPVGSKVCWFKQVGAECHGRALQHLDAGLVICSILATHVHRRLTASAPPPSTPALGLGPPRRAAAEEPERTAAPGKAPGLSRAPGAGPAPGDAAA